MFMSFVSYEIILCVFVKRHDMDCHCVIFCVDEVSVPRNV